MHKQPPLFAFFGTPRLATIILDRLEAHGLLPALIITAPDKPRGRGLESMPSPTKRWALERSIDVIAPLTLKDPAFAAEFANTPWDLFVVAAYSKLIPKSILAIPRRGTLNVHPSLLPKFRGPSPVTSAILADERTTGVTIMLLNEEMDEGPIVAQAKVELEPEAWPLPNSLLEDLLATEGANLLVEVFESWIEGNIEAEPQDNTLATYTKKFNDTDALLDLTNNPRENFLKIRAFDTNPRAYFLTSAGKRVVVTDAEHKEGKLIISRVIPEGKKEMLYEDFLRGQR
jgi:methionyl-tRNA formyltransferase